MTPSAQLPLELPHRPALGREDFLVTEANALAVAWIDAWPDWPQPALVLYGPADCGKTHLAQVWRRASDAVEVDGRNLYASTPPELLGSHGRASLVDGVDSLLADAADSEELERRLLHLYNFVRERSGHLLLTARQPPGAWSLRVRDLSSRLGAAPAIALGPPDDRLLEAVLVKLFADRQLRVPPEVVRFLVPRMERSMTSARRLVDALDAASLAARKEITVPLARRVLEREARQTGAQPQGENENGSGTVG